MTVTDMNRLVMGAAVVLTSLLASCSQSLRSVDKRHVHQANCAASVDPHRSAFVLLEVRSGRIAACNPERGGRRFTPASTYKIAHALLALESGVVQNENLHFHWDGRSRGVAAWDRNMSLAEAISASAVWVFQTVATHLGHAREAEGVKRLRYGNGDVGSPQDLRRFWLSGPLAISAFEQVDFLARLRAGQLKVDSAVQTRTRSMLRLRSCGRACEIYGKTGAVLPIDDDGFLRSSDDSLLPSGMERTGWFVGWVERPAQDGGPVVFAHNLDLGVPGSMKARTHAAYALLQANGVELELNDEAR